MLIFCLVAEKIEGIREKKKKNKKSSPIKPEDTLMIELSVCDFFFLEFDDDGDEFYLFFHRSQEVIAREAIKHALKALRKRHLLEEGAHAPAFIAISGPIASQVFHLLQNW